MQVGERYSKLLELAHENSSEKRRELLHDVTDMFFNSSQDRSELEGNMFGELMAKVAYELDVEVRKELTTRFKGGDAPRSLAVALANDQEISVAGPILRRSTSLSQADLISVVETRGNAHRLMVTGRSDVSEALSDALVNYGDDNVVAALVRNEAAKVSHETIGRIVERAAYSPVLQEPLVNRKSIAPDHLNKMFLSVNQTLRNRILERNSQYSEEDFNAAMARAQTRVAVENGALPADFEAATAEISLLNRKKALVASLLPTLWREKKSTQFMLAFAELTGLDYHQTNQLYETKDIDGVAMVCRAAGFERALFVTLAVMIIGESGMNQASALGYMYNDVPVEAAQRALRFMKLRASTLARVA
jgi:uncharacterized protein (DUF2336 family)